MDAVPVPEHERLATGDCGVRWGLGSSGPRMLGLRCKLARGLEARLWLPPCPDGAVFVGTLDGVFGVIRALLLDDVGAGEASGDSRVGEAALRRTRFAF